MDDLAVREPNASLSARAARRDLQIAGALLGVVGAALAIWLWRIPPDYADNRLGVKVITLPSAEFQFDRSRVIYGDVTPGAVAAGAVRLRNETGRQQHVRIRGGASEPDVSKTLRVRITAGTTTVFNGEVQGLQSWTSDPVPIKSGKVETIGVQASLQRSPDGSFQGLGQEVTVSLEVQRSG
jgi:hypothetical protein